MKLKIAIIAGVSVFCIFCAALVVDAVFHHPQQTKDLLSRVIPLASEADAPADAVPAEIAEPAAMTAAETPADMIRYPQLSATSAKLETVTLGALSDEIQRTDDTEKYKFLIELTSNGAAVKQAILSEFKSREEAKRIEVLNANASYEIVKTLPLMLLSPLSNGKEVYSLANTKLWVAPVEADSFNTKSFFPLDKLNWKLVETGEKDQARFEAILKDADMDAPMLKVVKIYRVQPGSYELDCEITVENLSAKPLKVQMQIQGPSGLSQEEERQDTRKIMTAYLQEKTVKTHLLPATEIRQLEKEKIRPSTGFLTSLKNLFGKRVNPDVKLEQHLRQNDAAIAWAASTNKYFAAIVRPVKEGTSDSDAVFFGGAVFYDSQLLENSPAQQAGASFLLETSPAQPIQLAPANEKGSRHSLNLNVYLGPKDKRIFEKNETYRTLQYFQTIDFSVCCCPVSIIAPLAFGIIWLMNAMFMLMGPLGNYGVVIIILVFLVRLALHPITKKSQVSMMRMQKLGPKMQEIQAKYAGNKQEMNKQVMAMYKEQGASPVSGMLPMFLQMPIWIALWTAVNTSIDLRGAGFLPFWITDLASPDHLFRIPFAAQLQTIPLLGAVVPNYFNLLPILMGVVMYLQMKMTPAAPPSAQANSQMAQQQKMMMIMMPLLFPLMLYSGPSGVNLYIMSSTAAGVIEQKVIRKHLQEREEQEAMGKVPVTAKTGGKVKKKKPKPFFKG